MSSFELEVVAWLRDWGGAGGEGAMGIGDDMAGAAAGDAAWLMSSDMLLDGVHFESTRHSLAQIGRKAVACCLSDCAAMAAKPVAVTVSVAWPAGSTLADAKALFGGMRELAAEFDTAIVGGDTTRWPDANGRLAIDVAVLAAPHEGIQPVKRSGAKVGDGVFVTGMLGGSRRGRHLSFTPRVGEARAIAAALGGRLHAMIDISDGLALDLWRLCEASGVGAMLDETRLTATISEDAKRLSDEDGVSPLDHALSDGEDFELLFAAEGSVSVPAVEAYPIGEVTRSGLRLRRMNGAIEPLEPTGFTH